MYDMIEGMGMCVRYDMCGELNAVVIYVMVVFGSRKWLGKYSICLEILTAPITNQCRLMGQN